MGHVTAGVYLSGFSPCPLSLLEVWREDSNRPDWSSQALNRETWESEDDIDMHSMAQKEKSCLVRRIGGGVSEEIFPSGISFFVVGGFWTRNRLTKYTVYTDISSREAALKSSYSHVPIFAISAAALTVIISSTNGDRPTD